MNMMTTSKWGKYYLTCKLIHEWLVSEKTFCTLIFNIVLLLSGVVTAHPVGEQRSCWVSRQHLCPGLLLTLSCCSALVLPGSCSFDTSDLKESAASSAFFFANIVTCAAACKLTVAKGAKTARHICTDEKSSVQTNCQHQREHIM